MNIRHYCKRIFVRLSILSVVGIALVGCGEGGDQLFYVALGDSLSVGVQQNLMTGENAPTDQGYTDQLFALLQPMFPNLELVKLGCPGETTVSMIEGGVCDTYETGNQLDDALEFLVPNQDQILLVTIDIGANDALQALQNPQTGCLLITDPAQQQACIMQAFTAIGTNLGLINNKLFQASDGVFPVLGMNYYNPLANAFFVGGLPALEATTNLTVGFNTEVLGAAYGAFGFPVADVQTAFSTTDSTIIPTGLPPPLDMLPLNVATACQLTYECPPPTSGLMPDIHANTAGYKVIADVFFALFNSLQ